STPRSAWSIRCRSSSAATTSISTLRSSGSASHPRREIRCEATSRRKPRAELTSACRALDRLIRAGRYWIPHWYKASHWIAYWDTFGRPPSKPKYARGVLETWWYDPKRAAKIEQPG